MSGPARDAHEEFDELAVGWALHALEPEDEAAFAGHLAGCGRCAQTVAETSEVMAALAAALPSAEPSPSLRDRLRAEVAGTEQVPAAIEQPRTDPRHAVPSVATPLGTVKTRMLAGMRRLKDHLGTGVPGGALTRDGGIR